MTKLGLSRARRWFRRNIRTLGTSDLSRPFYLTTLRRANRSRDPRYIGDPPPSMDYDNLTTLSYSRDRPTRISAFHDCGTWVYCDVNWIHITIEFLNWNCWNWITPRSGMLMHHVRHCRPAYGFLGAKSCKNDSWFLAFPKFSSIFIETSLALLKLLIQGILR